MSDVFKQELDDAERNHRESYAEDPNCYGTGYDAGYCEGLRQGYRLGQQGTPPREPTEAMLDAGVEASESQRVSIIWRAMHDAASTQEPGR